MHTRSMGATSRAISFTTIAVIAICATTANLFCEANPLVMQHAKMDISLEPHILQGRLEVLSKAKSGDKLPITLTKQLPIQQQKPKPLTAEIQTKKEVATLKAELAAAQNKKLLEANATNGSTQKIVQLSQKDFIADWGGEVVVTSRKIYATDVPAAPLVNGDRGPTLIRVSALTPTTVKVPPPTVFISKAYTVGPEARAVGEEPDFFENILGFFGARRLVRYITIGGGTMQFHDGLGNQFHQSILHDSVKILGKDSLEADSVSAKTDAHGKIVEYEERVVRLFKNSQGNVYAKLAFAKYDSERTLERQTLLEGWLSAHSDAPRKITDITLETFQDTVHTFGL